MRQCTQTRLTHALSSRYSLPYPLVTLSRGLLFLFPTPPPPRAARDRGSSHERQLAGVARARAAGQGSSSTHGQHAARARGREGQRRAASAPPHADVAPCPCAWKKAGASTAKYAMGPRSPDKQPVEARFFFRLQPTRLTCESANHTALSSELVPSNPFDTRSTKKCSGSCPGSHSPIVKSEILQ